MKNAFVFLPVLCATAFLDSCTSLSTSLATYTVQPKLAVHHSKETPEMYYDLGRFYQAQSRWDDAARAYERALALKSDQVEATNALATCYAMQGRYEIAASKLQEAIKRAPDAAHLHSNLGYVLYLQGRHQDAIAALETATQLQPANARALRNLGLAYAAADFTEKSRAAYTQARRATSQVFTEYSPATRLQPPTDPGEMRPSPAIRDLRDGTVSNARLGLPGASTRVPSFEVVPVAPNVYEMRPLGASRASASTGAPVIEQPVQRHIPALALKPFRVEVSNGNGKTGMARRVANLLKPLGIQTVRLTNQIPWQPGTEIQFSEGYALEAAKLAGLLNHQVLTVRNDRMRRDIHVRLVLGKSVGDLTAFLAPAQPTASGRVASAK